MVGGGDGGEGAAHCGRESISVIQELFTIAGKVFFFLKTLITLRFTYAERKICSTIKKSQNFMSMIVALISFFVSIFQNIFCQQ